MAPLTNLQTRAVETLIHPYTNQATIRDTGPLVFERKAFEEKTAGAQEDAKKNGMSFHELTDREKWVYLMRPAWDAFGKATPGAAELIKIIQSS